MVVSFKKEHVMSEELFSPVHLLVLLVNLLIIGGGVFIVRRIVRK